MRVIGGALRGKKLKSFRGRRIRPTSDRVKEALFNIIGIRPLEGAAVLDLYAGTGNLGIEALSRGAAKACFVERDRESLKLLRENLYSCMLCDRARIIPMDAGKAIGILEEEGESFDVIFLDPPYGRGLAAKTLEILGGSAVAARAIIVAEHAYSDRLKDRYGDLVMTDSRRYGDTSLSFFERE